MNSIGSQCFVASNSKEVSGVLSIPWIVGGLNSVIIFVYCFVLIVTLPPVHGDTNHPDTNKLMSNFTTSIQLPKQPFAKTTKMKFYSMPAANVKLIATHHNKQSKSLDGSFPNLQSTNATKIPLKMHGSKML